MEKPPSPPATQKPKRKRILESSEPSLASSVPDSSLDDLIIQPRQIQKKPTVADLRLEIDGFSLRLTALESKVDAISELLISTLEGLKGSASARNVENITSKMKSVSLPTTVTLISPRDKKVCDQCHCFYYQCLCWEQAFTDSY